jgi:nucleoside-diphosphate-sugar epimerase
MALQVIVGAGPVGTETARLLAERGEQVRLVSRHGGASVHPAVELVSADATDAERLSRLAAGATALYNCASPAYHRWLTDWPPLAAAVLTTAERCGAVLATANNLYGYGPVTEPMTETMPQAATHPKLRLRADMWQDALALHQAGRIRATEVRSSDYIEAHSIITLALGKPLLAGRRAFLPSPLDVPHSWTSIADVARTLVAAASDARAWGRPWHVPTNPPLTVRELARRFSEVAHAPDPKLSTIPYPVLWTVGLFSPLVRELRITRYQFERPFVLNSSLATETFGIEPTPLEDALTAAAASLRAE